MRFLIIAALLILLPFGFSHAKKQQLSLKQKIGQLTQPDVRWISPEQVKNYNIGSVLRGGGTLHGEDTDEALNHNGPKDWAQLVHSYKVAALNSETGLPLIFAVDAVHGHNNVTGATLFPHNIGLGATRDASLLESIGKATAWEVFVTGIDWNFAPTVAVARNENWGRTYESFSENPEIVTTLGTSYIRGLQAELVNGHRIIATAKHWIGDGGTTRGVDQGNTELPLKELKEHHMPPYVAALAQGVPTVMISFNSFNGKKLHEHQKLINGLLRGELGFNGVVITDWNGIDQIKTPMNLKGDAKYMYQIAQAFHAGIDIFMVPENWKRFIRLTHQLVNNHKNGISPFVSEERINQSVERLLRLKRDYGLKDKPLPLELFESYKQKFSSSEHRSLAKLAAQKSAVLLKKEELTTNIIEPGDSILVLGEAARNTGYQAGGWSLAWQGVKRNIPGSESLFEGIKSKMNSMNLNVHFDLDGKTSFRPSKVMVVIGEEPYSEGEGDRAQPGPRLNSKDILLINEAQSFGVPVTVILINGRPLILPDEIEHKMQNIISYWLPGTMGSALSDLLVGEKNFTGRLPFSWPRNSLQLDYDYRSENILWKYPFGFGL